MNSQESEYRSWQPQQNKTIPLFFKKAIIVSLVLLAGVLEFYFLPGKWRTLSLEITPILVFAVIFGRYFRDQILSESDSHAPLITLGAIYIGICWFLFSHAH